MRSRVVLDDPTPADEAPLLALIRESRAFLRGRASGPTTSTQYARYRARCARSDFVGWLVRRREDGAILGMIELSQIVRGGFRSAYLGYLIGAPHARQGYMAEAIGLALRQVFTTLRLHRVEANIQPGNRASLALVAKLGFRREGYSRRYLKIAGRWRDHERWALLAEEWRARGRGSRRPSAPTALVSARSAARKGPQRRPSTRGGSSPASGSSATRRGVRRARRRS